MDQRLGTFVCLNVALRRREYIYPGVMLGLSGASTKLVVFALINWWGEAPERPQRFAAVCLV
jgi:hypothetical protein